MRRTAGFTLIVYDIDLDGTLSCEYFVYSDKGKKYKLFGPDDSDALKILNKYLNI